MRKTFSVINGKLYDWSLEWRQRNDGWREWWRWKRWELTRAKKVNQNFQKKRTLIRTRLTKWIRKLIRKTKWYQSKRAISVVDRVLSRFLVEQGWQQMRREQCEWVKSLDTHLQNNYEHVKNVWNVCESIAKLKLKTKYIILDFLLLLSFRLFSLFYCTHNYLG